MNSPSASAPLPTLMAIIYYRYPMNPELRFLLAELQSPEIEVWYCTSEDQEAIRQKIEAVAAFAGEKQAIWKAVREIQPA